MSGHMTMKQAFECGDCDFPFIAGDFNCLKSRGRQYTKKRILSGEMGAESIKKMVENSISDKWQVKPAEPKVLTADEIINRGETWQSLVITNLTQNDAVRIDLDRMFTEAHRNGRLDRNIELNQIFVDLENMLKCDDEDLSYWQEVFFHTLENLKPLNEDSKLKQESERA
jgi:hypothetical protein